MKIDGQGAQAEVYAPAQTKREMTDFRTPSVVESHAITTRRGIRAIDPQKKTPAVARRGRSTFRSVCGT